VELRKEYKRDFDIKAGSTVYSLCDYHLRQQKWRNVVHSVLVRPNLPFLCTKKDITSSKRAIMNLFAQRNVSNAQIIEDVEYTYKESQIKQYCEKIKNHLKILCGDDSEEFLERFIVGIFQEHDEEMPPFRPQSAPVIVTSFGLGKTKFFRRIFEYAFGHGFNTLANAKFGKLGQMDSIVGKSIVILDELIIGSDNQWKEFAVMVDENQYWYRPMYAPKVKVDNYTKFIVLQNNPQLIKRLIEERRFPFVEDNGQNVCYECWKF